jgi:hypothetical protein
VAIGVCRWTIFRQARPPICSCHKEWVSIGICSGADERCSISFAETTNRILEAFRPQRANSFRPSFLGACHVLVHENQIISFRVHQPQFPRSQLLGSSTSAPLSSQNVKTACATQGHRRQEDREVFGSSTTFVLMYHFTLYELPYYSYRPLLGIAVWLRMKEEEFNRITNLAPGESLHHCRRFHPTKYHHSANASDSHRLSPIPVPWLNTSKLLWNFSNRAPLFQWEFRDPSPPRTLQQHHNNSCSEPNKPE